MSVLALKIKNHFNKDIVSLCIIPILVAILIIIQNNYFSILYPIGLCLGIGLFTLVLKYPKVGLYLLIFNLPLNLYIPMFGLGGDRFSISVNEVLMLLLLVSLIVKKLYHGKLTFPKSSLNRPIFLLIAVNALSLLFAISDLSSADYMKCWLYFFLWAEYFLIYFLILDLVKTEKEIKTIFALLVIAGIISVISAIYQQFAGSELHSIGVITETGKTFYRLATPFGFYSNHFGAYLLIILSILFHFYFAKNNRNKIIYLMIILPTLYALFYTFSRASFIGLIVLVVMLFVTQKKHRRQIVIISLLFIIAALMIFGPVFLRWQKKAPIMKSGRLYLEHNIRERLSQWEASLDQFLKYPVIGKGFSTYNYRPVNYDSYFGFVKYIDHPDNSYVKLLIESGILGVILFFMFVLKIYSSAFKLSKSNPNLKQISFITITALSCFLVTSFFETMFTVGRVTGTIFVLVGIMMVRAKNESFKA